MEQEGPESERLPGAVFQYVLSYHASMKSLQVDIAQLIVRSEHEVMPRHQLLDSVPSRLARSNDVASQRLDEMQEGDNGSFVRSRRVPMEVAIESDMTCSQGQHSRESSPTRMRAGNTITGPLRMTSALRSAAHNWQHMSCEEYSVSG